MAKEKIRCARCHKQFKGSPKQTLCPDCERLVRQARAAAKASTAAPAAQAKPTVAPRIMGAGAGILDPRLAAMPSSIAPDLPAPAHPTEPQRDHDHRHEHGAASTPHAPHDGEMRQHPAHPKETSDSKDARDKKHGAGPKAAQASRPKKEPKPPTPPFELTDELRARVEARYLELATPVEFDGIRTQIAGELSIPKVAVKRAVHDLRDRMQLPSWWELQAYEGTPADLERIRAAYTPLLPLPDVGVHLRLASELELEPRAVYQGIRRIRAEMRLPQYNPPEAHGLPSAQEPATATPATGASETSRGTAEAGTSA